MASPRSSTLILAVLSLATVCVSDGSQSSSLKYQIAMNDLCPRGTYMFNQTSTPVECRKCPNGSYTDKENDQDKCNRCKGCTESFNRVKRKCTSTHNTKCKCSPGRYWDHDVLYCLKCDECQRGEGVVRECGGRNNTKCEPCQEGHTFADNSSLSEKCRPCSKCDADYDVDTQCTRGNNTVCRPKLGNGSKLPSSGTGLTGGTEPTSRLPSRTAWTTEPTAAENQKSVTENSGSAIAELLTTNIVIGVVAGSVVVILLIVVVLVLRKKLDRSTNSCSSKAAAPPPHSSTSVTVSLNENMETKRSSRLLLPPYGPDKYIREVSFSLISELSRHLNPDGRWKILAGRLGFTNTDISNINIKPEESTENMLNRWGQRHNSTLHHLYEVVMSLGWKHEAGLIKKYIFLP